MSPDEAIAVAIEQTRWWRDRGWSPAMVFRALDFTEPAHPSWDDAVYAIAIAWWELPRPDPAPAALVAPPQHVRPEARAGP